MPLPTSPTFWDFNIGHLITVITCLVSLVIVWTKLSDKVDNLGARLLRSETDLDTITRMGLITTIQQHERRITEIESIIRDVATIKADLTWIKESLMREHNT